MAALSAAASDEEPHDGPPGRLYPAARNVEPEPEVDVSLEHQTLTLLSTIGYPGACTQIFTFFKIGRRKLISLQR